MHFLFNSLNRFKFLFTQNLDFCIRYSMEYVTAYLTKLRDDKRFRARFFQEIGTVHMDTSIQAIVEFFDGEMNYVQHWEAENQRFTELSAKYQWTKDQFKYEIKYQFQNC